jgi:creatinine amidohydrolase
MGKLAGLFLEELSAPQLTDLLKKTETILIPLGSIEQHGPHLPIGTDLMIATEIARRISERMGCPVGPGISYGNSVLMKNMKGTFTLKPGTLAASIADICRACASQGFKTVVFVNGHAGNIGPLDQVGLEVTEETGIQVIRIDWWIIASREIAQILETELYHACEGETSLMLAIDQKLVNMEKAVKDDSMSDLKNKFTENRPEEMPEIYSPFERISKTGIVGDPEKASAAKGTRILDAVTENAVRFLKTLERQGGS